MLNGPKEEGKYNVEGTWRASRFRWPIICLTPTQMIVIAIAPMQHQHKTQDPSHHAVQIDGDTI